MGSDNLDIKLQQLAGNLKRWNSEVFGDIFRRKRQLISRLGGIQRAIQRRSNPHLYKLEEDLTREYNRVLYQEQLLWFQKSRLDWLEKGNKNTWFFHTATKVRRKHNKVESLLDTGGQWVYDQKNLQKMAMSFYESLFRDEGIDQSGQRIPGEFNTLEERELDYLKLEVSFEEVKNSLFSMGLYKAPGHERHSGKPQRR